MELNWINKKSNFSIKLYLSLLFNYTYIYTRRSWVLFYFNKITNLLLLVLEMETYAIYIVYSNAIFYTFIQFFYTLKGCMFWLYRSLVYSMEFHVEDIPVLYYDINKCIEMLWLNFIFWYIMFIFENAYGILIKYDNSDMIYWVDVIKYFWIYDLLLDVHSTSKFNHITYVHNTFCYSVLICIIKI